MREKIIKTIQKNWGNTVLLRTLCMANQMMTSYQFARVNFNDFCSLNLHYRIFQKSQVSKRSTDDYRKESLEKPLRTPPTSLSSNMLNGVDDYRRKQTKKEPFLTLPLLLFPLCQLKWCASLYHKFAFFWASFIKRSRVFYPESYVKKVLQ